MKKSFGKKICPACLDDMDGHFVKVRDYLDEFPNASVELVSDETEVPKSVILQLIKEGRLIIGDGSKVSSKHCEVCKKPIYEGRMCVKCQSNLQAIIEKNTGGKKPAVSSQGDSMKGSAKIGK